MTSILIISPEPWEAQFVSKHHFALELAKRGHHVIFHGPPETIAASRMEPVPNTQERLNVLRAPRVAPGLRFMPSQLRQFLESRWLGQTEEIVGKHIDVVWNFENSRFYDMRFAGSRLKIYQQVDLNQAFQPEIAAATADLTIAISGPIAARLEGRAKRLIRLTHGCTPHIPCTTVPERLELEFACPGVHAVMVGNLTIPYLDIALLHQLVVTHPQVRFHFVGQFNTGRGLHAAIAEAPNAVFWGRQSSATLPAFLRQADVLLVAYTAKTHLEQLANPHKILEYLASGRCVLATRTLEYEETPGLIEIASDANAYAAKFAQIVADPASWNTPDLIARRQAFAADNSYSRQLDRIAAALGPRAALIL